jgi:hypothetical protein
MNATLRVCLLPLLLSTSLMIAGAGPVFAEEGTSPQTAIFYTVVTTGAITTVVGGVGLTVLLVNRSNQADLETYLRDNAVALQHDLTFGAGATTRDLAAAFHVPEEHVPVFAALLRTHRHQLLPLTATEQLDEHGASEFVNCITAAMLHYPELTPLLEILSVES